MAIRALHCDSHNSPDWHIFERPEDLEEYIGFDRAEYGGESIEDVGMLEDGNGDQWIIYREGEEIYVVDHVNDPDCWKPARLRCPACEVPNTVPGHPGCQGRG
jgi:hypothetical protein